MLRLRSKDPIITNFNKRIAQRFCSILHWAIIK
jgi:hypothetical protein